VEDPPPLNRTVFGGPFSPFPFDCRRHPPPPKLSSCPRWAKGVCSFPPEHIPGLGEPSSPTSIDSPAFFPAQDFPDKNGFPCIAPKTPQRRSRTALAPRSQDPPQRCFKFQVEISVRTSPSPSLFPPPVVKASVRNRWGAKAILPCVRPSAAVARAPRTVKRLDSPPFF